MRNYLTFDSNKNVSVCQVDGCGVEIKGNHAGNLEKHFKSCHRYESDLVQEERLSRKRKAGEGEDGGRPKKICVRINRKTIVDSCIDLVAVHGRPLQLIDDRAFRKIIDPLIEGLGGGFSITSRNIREQIRQRASLIRNKITQEVENRLVSMKFDSCTRLNRSILGINLQFIKNGKIKIRTIEMTEIRERHTFDNLKRIVKNTLNRFNLNTENVVSCTTDNGANMTKAVKLLS